MSKFPVCRSRNFEFELEISSLELQFEKVEISTLNSKFPVWRSRNFELLVGYIVVLVYWFINHSLNWKFRVRTGNFDFFKLEFELEISSWDVEISSLPKSKFRVWTWNFQLGCRNFQFAEVEISSLEVEISSLELEISTLNSKFPVWRSRNFELLVGYIVVLVYWFINHSLNWKFRVRTGNFDFFKLEISTFQLEISSFELEISTSSNWKFRHSNWKFRVRTGNFHFVQLEISSLNWKFRHPNWKFRVAFQARMWHQYAFVYISVDALAYMAC